VRRFSYAASEPSHGNDRSRHGATVTC
jgi:hypothetical protein